MLNPSSASKTPLSSRIALSGALLLAGLFGLAGAILLPSANSKKTAALQVHEAPQTVPALASTPSTSPPNPKSIPAPSSDDLVEFCSKNVTAQRSFVLFSRGTCVIIDEPCAKPLEEARKRLAACAKPDVEFLSEPTREGDLIVTFKQPVFHRFSRDELSQLFDWVATAAPTLLTPSETIAAGDGWTPAPHARFGLLARRRLLEDAVNTVPVRVIRAKSREIAAN